MDTHGWLRRTRLSIVDAQIWQGTDNASSASPDRHPEDGRDTGDRWPRAGASDLALGWVLVSGTRFVVPVLLPRIKTAFTITNTSAGFAVTLLWRNYAALQFSAGLLTDRWGERTLLQLSLAVTTVSVLAFAAALVFELFLGASLLFGLGISLFGLPRVMLLSRSFPQNDGTAIGVTFAAGNVGAVVLPFLAGWVGSQYGRRLGIGVLAPLFVLVLGGLWRIVSPRAAADAKAVDASPRHAVPDSS